MAGRKESGSETIYIYTRAKVSGFVEVSGFLVFQLYTDP